MPLVIIVITIIIKIVLIGTIAMVAFCGQPRSPIRLFVNFCDFVDFDEIQSRWKKMSATAEQCKKPDAAALGRMSGRVCQDLDRVCGQDVGEQNLATASFFLKRSCEEGSTAWRASGGFDHEGVSSFRLTSAMEVEQEEEDVEEGRY